MNAKPVVLALLAGVIGLGIHTALAQDEPVPKPKPKSATPSSKSAAKSSPQATGPSLLLLCDLACDWKLDGGVAKGHIDAGGSAKVHVELGQHQVIATSADSQDELKQLAEVKQSGQTLMSLELKPLRDTRLQQAKESSVRAEQARKLQEEMALRTWKDTGTDWSGPGKIAATATI